MTENTNTIEKNKILIICPTRGRSHKMEKFYQAFKENSVMSDLLFVLDEDDQQNYERILDPNVMYEVGFRNGIVPAINTAAYKYAQSNQYELIGMLNDDHIIRTPNWDEIIYNTVRDQEISISYPNDLFVYENAGHKASDIYASAVILSTNIIKILGYMANPMFFHTWVDHIWLDMGRRMKCLNYFSDVIVEHMHPHAGKDEYDEVYMMYHKTKPALKQQDKDKALYEYYIENCLDNDIDRVRSYLKISSAFK